MGGSKADIAVQRLTDYLLKQIDMFRNLNSRNDVYYIVEPRNWSIYEDGVAMARHLASKKIAVTRSINFIKTGIIHYGTINLILDNFQNLKPSQNIKTLVTWFHVIPDDPRLKHLPEILPFVDHLHTASTICLEKLVDLGIKREHITMIPIGINTEQFHPLENSRSSQRRKEFGIPKDHVIIGSFQKDGVGWGMGNEPKLIKGPDIFCDCLEQLNRQVKVFALLTGPARGYVKKRLVQAGIPYLHKYLDSVAKLPQYYQLLDLYLITSRIEGGPKAILESMACGIPIISTKVGMAGDVIRHRENGFLLNSWNSKDISDSILDILHDQALLKTVTNVGLITAKQYSWRNLSAQYLAMYNLPQLN